MKYLFFPNDRNPTHVRTSDNVTGVLEAYPDTVQISGPAEVLTSDEGFTLIPEPEPTSEPEPVPPTPAELIKMAEAHIATYFTSFGLLEGLKKLLTAQATGNLAAIPKTVAIAAWVEEVKALALAGQTNFPPAPYTFEEVVAE